MTFAPQSIARQLGKKEAIIGVVAVIALLGLGIAAVAGVYAFYYSAPSCCVDNVRIVTLSSATLFSGTPTNASDRGTSAFAITLNNPGAISSISLITITGYNLTSQVVVYRCFDGTDCEPISSSNVPLPSGLTHFDTNSSAFYLSASLTEGQVYNYVINFANGQSVSGSLIAQGSIVLPDVSPNYSGAITSSSFSSASSCFPIAPYTTTYTEHYGNYSSVTFETSVVSCGLEADSTTITSSYTTCTGTPYLTMETINSSQRIYTTLATVYC